LSEQQRNLAARFFPRHLLESAVQGEFRQVTTVFLNLARDMTDAERAAFSALLFRILAQYDGFLGRVARIGGKDNGNTFLLFWGAPAGSERDVERALAFLLDLRAGSPIPLRAGVTTELAYAGFVGSPRREEYTCYGSYVNLAARQLIAAPFGEIWLDAGTAQRADGFALTARGEARFKGFDTPQPVYVLTGRSEESPTPFYGGRLIGRADELAQMTAALQPLQAGRFGGILAVIGEAGMGKSRLAHEFLQQVTGEPPDLLPPGEAATDRPSFSSPLRPQFFLCQTDEILRQPLNPFRYWLRRYFNQSARQSEAENKAAFSQKIEWLLTELESAQQPRQAESAEKRVTPVADGIASRTLQSEIDRTRSFLGALVDLRWEDSLYERLEPQLRYENTLDALKTLIKAESLRRPVILHLEDAHWLDAESGEFLTKLLRNVEEYALLIIATARPPERHEEDYDFFAALPDGTPYTLIDLTALTERNVIGLGEDLLDAPLHPSLAAELTQRADGNPFFAEQIVLYLQEQGLLRMGEQGWEMIDDGGFTAHKVLSGDARAVLTARLDRLPPPVKQVVQSAAVLGREFDTPVLMQMLADPPQFAANLTAATDASIWTAVAQARYLFRHALLRDAAYDMQLRDRLRRLHYQAGKAMEAFFAAELAPRYADLAHHYHRAEATREERHFAELAGAYAAERYANQDARRLLTRALELTTPDDVTRRIRLLKARTALLDLIGDRPAQQADLEELTRLAQQDVAERTAVLLQRVDYFRNTGNYATAVDLAQQAVREATAIAKPELQMHTLHLLGRVQWQMARFGEARRALRAALAFNDEVADSAFATRCKIDIGVSYEQEGNLAAASRYFDEALATTEMSQNQMELVRCLGMSGVVSHRHGDYAAAERRYREAIEICRSIGWRYGEGICLRYLSNNEFVLGNYASSEQLLIEAMALSREITDWEGMALAHDTLALIATMQGRTDEALIQGNQALKIQEEIGHRRSIAYTLVHLGHVHVDRGELQEADRSFRRAFRIRSELGDRAGQLDAQGGLLRMLMRQDRMAEALDLADEILDGLAGAAAAGVEFPTQLYALCMEAFVRRHAEARIIQAREAGLKELTRIASMVPDAATRHRLIRHGPFHAKFLAALGLTPERFLEEYVVNAD
jgi:predicted ATPase